MKHQKIRVAGVLAACAAALALTITATSFLVRETPQKGAQPAAVPAASAAPEYTAPAALTQTFASDDVTLDSPRGVALHATVTLPETAQGAPVVVMCHGFTGNRDGDGHFEPLAQRLAAAGIASIRVDFAGNGESEEPFTAYTLTSMQQDVESALSHMAENYGVDTSSVGLLGHSMGGRLVSLLLGDTVAAAALWSPANGDGLDGVEFLDHDAAGRQELLAQAEEAGSVALSGWNVTVSAEYLQEMAESHPADAIAAYGGPLLLAYAGGDPELLSQQTIDETVTAASGRQNAVFTDLSGGFGDATHNYTALSGDAAEDAAIRSRIEQATAEFFITQLGGAA